MGLPDDEKEPEFDEVEYLEEAEEDDYEEEYEDDDPSELN